MNADQINERLQGELWDIFEVCRLAGMVADLASCVASLETRLKAAEDYIRELQMENEDI